MRKTEVAGVAELLLADYNSPEEAASRIIRWLDNDRAKRTSYVAIMQFGGIPEGTSVFYVGLGPYPGAQSARKAVLSHPAAGEAKRLAVVPMKSAEGVAEMIRHLDSYVPLRKKDDE